MKIPAWIISITDTLSVAVGEFELVHILPDMPELFHVPNAPPYCQQVFIWENKIIPVMNLAEKLCLEQHSATHSRIVISIFAYRINRIGVAEYCALFSDSVPHQIDISDEQACPLSADLYSWTPYFRSCFQEAETKKIIPILKLERLFTYQHGTAV
jgi:chemotaxis signal transduction protein